MSFSDNQIKAIRSVTKWHEDRNAPQIFRLFGYAGTGKTTIAKEIAEEVSGNVEFACFTGKASQVLRQKGCRGAGTIHSLIYNPVSTGPGKVEFTLKKRDECSLGNTSLLIVDEVSMVGEDIARDLLSFGCKILALGDPAQLPPVFGEGFFTNATPDFMLTEVHRQARDNPIIRMSMDVREKRHLVHGAYGDSLIVASWNMTHDQMRGHACSADQVLCGTNKKRHTLNSLIRKERGLVGEFHPDMPAVGDRLVCLKNKRDKGLFNGALFTVVRVTNDAKFSSLELKSLDDERDNVEVIVPAEMFIPGTVQMNWAEMLNYEQFNYGWGLTVHKSQGSQWENVTVFDESRAFREHAANHLYTAITRAREKVTVIQ